LTAVTGLSTLAATSGGGALYSHLNDSSHASSPHSQGGPQAAQNSANNAQNGLITPQDNDPVLFTTQSGVEIKMGNTLPSTYNKHLGSGNLQSFAYFTTNDGTKTYTWVIIGASDSLTLSYDYKYPQISSLSDTTSTGIFKSYYDNNIFENTPAGIAIDADKAKQLILDSVTQTSEIPDGCVLCLANNYIETGAANNTVGYYYWGWEVTILSSTYVGDIATTMDNYYNNGSLGLSSITSNIQPIESLLTYGAVSSGNLDTYVSSNSVKSYVFPLASSKNTNNSFKFDTYLTSDQMKLSSTQWLRGGEVYKVGQRHGLGYVMDSSGTTTTTTISSSTPGYRPAFCLKLT
ncbi:MAG: hypothetical protein J6A98_02720, partial [Clostridia bacterium]|nr:hypothetical protein [Clostridia bacterium]